MSAAYVCDECGKVSETRGMLGWYEVSGLGIEAPTFGQRPFPWTYCSRLCVAQGMNDEKAAMCAVTNPHCQVDNASR